MAVASLNNHIALESFTSPVFFGNNIKVNLIFCLWFEMGEYLEDHPV